MQCIKAVQHTAKYQDAKNYVRFVLSEIKKKLCSFQRSSSLAKKTNSVLLIMINLYIEELKKTMSDQAREIEIIPAGCLQTGYMELLRAM